MVLLFHLIDLMHKILHTNTPTRSLAWRAESPQRSEFAAVGATRALASLLISPHTHDSQRPHAFRLAITRNIPTMAYY